MKNILLITMFVFSVFIMSGCGEEVEFEGQGRHLEGDNRSERLEERDIRGFEQEEHGREPKAWR